MSARILEVQNYNIRVCGSSPVDVDERSVSVVPRLGDSVVGCVEITSLIPRLISVSTTLETDSRTCSTGVAVELVPGVSRSLRARSA